MARLSTPAPTCTPVGSVLYELLTGRPPFQGETAVATAYQHVSEAPIPPNAINPAVSPALNAVVMRSLAKDRVERYQTATDFRADLEIALSGKVPDHGPVADDFNATCSGQPPLVLRVGGHAASPGRGHGGHRVPRTQTRPPVAWLWGGIALLVVIIVAAGFWIVNLSPRRSSATTSPSRSPTSSVRPTRTVGTNCSPWGWCRSRWTWRTKRSRSAPFSPSIPRWARSSVRVRKVRVSVSSGPPRVALVGLTFKTEQQAKDIIAGLKLVYGETTVAYSPNVPKDQVIGIQLPPDQTLVTAARRVVKGSTVNLVVSNGLVQVPDLTGQAVTQAQATLTGSDLQLSVRLTPDNSCSGQNVTSQSISGDQPQKSTVELVYCAA